MSAAVVTATPAAAQVPAPPAPYTVTVTGTAQVKPKPLHHTDASIAKSVKVARTKAYPLAIGNGQGRAASLAKATGFRLDELIAVSAASPSVPVYFGPYFGEDGTFGPGKYCGTVRSSIVHTDAQGRRRVVGTKSRHTCRVPAAVSVSLTMTYSAVPAAPDGS